MNHHPLAILIEQARAQAGLSSYQLAALAGVGTTTLSNLKLGVAAPRLPTARRLARALGYRLQFVVRYPDRPGNVLASDRPGHLLKRARRAAGLNQVALGEKSGLGQTPVSDYEVGRREPGYDGFSRLVEACGGRLEVELVPFRKDLGLSRVRCPQSGQDASCPAR
jgi:transcriptional regulator with XRE-family HTH domain